MRVDLFDFELPRDLIAQIPAKPRDSARLMHVADHISDLFVRDLPSLLRPGDALVVNDTKVLPCRLIGSRGSTKVSITLHKALSADTWLAFAKPAKKLNLHDVVNFINGLEGRIIEKLGFGEITLIFNKSGQELISALETSGFMPLPPYIKREHLGSEGDRQNYQTFFASKPGAVAAPTAGLHFTPNLISAIEAQGVKLIRITLHVGAGTFLPVKVEDTDDHIMHTERATLGIEAAEILSAVKRNGKQIIAVGSTALRTLETAAADNGAILPFSGETDCLLPQDIGLK